MDLAYKDPYLLLKVSFYSKYFSKGAQCGVKEALRKAGVDPFGGNQATG